MRNTHGRVPGGRRAPQASRQTRRRPIGTDLARRNARQRVKPSPRKTTVHLYRDRRHRFLWGYSRGRKLALALPALALIVAVILGIVLALRNVSRSSPTPPSTEAPVEAPAATLVPTATPAPAATPVALPAVTPLTLPGPDVSASKPSLAVSNRASLIAVFRWMIASGTQTTTLESLTLDREGIMDVADKFSNYFENCGFSRESPRLTVEFKSGLRVLTAIQADAVERLSQAEQAMAWQAQAAVDGLIRPGMTDLEKELAIHDYVAERCEYMDSAGQDETPNSARGFFENALCRCAGYADTFRLLARLAGLDVETIGGPTTQDLPGEKGHAWNLIRLDGLWYAVDVTWDDMIGGASSVEHVFFNLPYSSFGGSRRSEPDCCPPGDYAAAIDGNYYYNQPACIAATEEDALAAATRQLEEAGRAYIYFTGEDLSAPLSDALSRRYGSRLHATELSEQLNIAVYKYTLR